MIILELNSVKKLEIIHEQRDIFFQISDFSEILVGFQIRVDNQ